MKIKLPLMTKLMTILVPMLTFDPSRTVAEVSKKLEDIRTRYAF